MSNSLDELLAAARDRQAPWDAARSERVLSQALTTRATRARSKATRYTVATACGAVLVLGFGIANGANGGRAQETSEPVSATHVSVDSQPPSASELAALARNDGGYGRD